MPRELTLDDLARSGSEFVDSARRGDEAGFDLLELHCAHGYLLSSFISPLTNQRTDEYGGSLENRLRFPLEVFTAIREVWPEDRPMTVRISATDWVEGGIDIDDAVEVARAFAAAGADAIDVSTGQVSSDERPDFGRSYQTPYADAIRNRVDIADDRRRGHLVVRRRQLADPGRPGRPVRARAGCTSTTRCGRCTPRSSQGYAGAGRALAGPVAARPAQAADRPDRRAASLDCTLIREGAGRSLPSATAAGTPSQCRASLLGFATVPSRMAGYRGRSAQRTGAACHETWQTPSG